MEGVVGSWAWGATVAALEQRTKAWGVSRKANSLLGNTPPDFWPSAPGAISRRVMFFTCASARALWVCVCVRCERMQWGM